MRTMPAGEFKAKCLAVMDEVKASGQEVIVTKHGKPVARLAPLEGQVQKESPEAIFGCLSGIATIVGDPDAWIEPLIPAEDWDHLKPDWSLFPSE
jgi:prevent-host-death family protein